MVALAFSGCWACGASGPYTCACGVFSTGPFGAPARSVSRLHCPCPGQNSGGRAPEPYQPSPSAPTQNVMPLSAGLFKSEHRNPVPQCPPRLHVQFLSHVLWSRMPNQFLKVDVSRVSERQGWLVQCAEPLQFMSLHIPEENRSALRAVLPGGDAQRHRCRGGGGGGHKARLKTPHCCGHGDAILYIPSLNPFLSHFVTEIVTVPWSRRQNDGAPFPPALGRPPRGRAGHAASQRAGVADGIRVPELSRHVTPEKKETP